MPEEVRLEGAGLDADHARSEPGYAWRAMSLPTFPDEFNLAEYYLFDRLKEGFADTPAILFGDRSYTYGDVALRTQELQRFMAARSVRAEERVLIVLHDTPAFAWAFFATLSHGAVVAMGNPEAPTADLAHLVSYTRATVVITIPRVAAALREVLAEAGLRALILCREVATGEDVLSSVAIDHELASQEPIGLDAALAQGAELLAQQLGAPKPTLRDDIAIWLFTSGSTGKSKANIHAHRDFAFNTEVYAKRTVHYRAGDVTVSVPRLFFGYATGTNLMFPFAVGATTALFAERPTPESLCSAISRHKPTIVTNVPTMMSKLLEHDDARRARGETGLDFSSVRFHLSAGEALPERVHDFRDALVLRIARAPPGGPGFFGALEIGDDEIRIVRVLAQPARLRADVLNVEMPVVAGLQSAPDGLLDRVPIGQRVEDEPNGLGFIERRGRIDHATVGNRR